jgi:hypothetical protein
MALKFELRALHFSREGFYHVNHTPNPFFALIIFQGGSPFFLGRASGLRHNPPSYTSLIADITEVNHHASLVKLGGVLLIFPQAVVKL